MKQRTPPPAAAPSCDRPAWQSFGFAGLMLVAALMARWLMDPFTREAVPLATMYIAVAFAVWFGGWKSAALLAVTGYVAALWCFFPPRYSFKLWEAFGILRSALYAGSCAITIYLCESMRRAQRKHAAAEANVFSILEHMREGFLAVDAEWRITSVNRSTEQLLGQSRDRLISRPLWDLWPRIAGQPAEAELRRALRDRVSVQFDTNTLAPGTWHAVTATPTNGDLSIFFQDISAQKAAVDKLERLVDDRTAALQRVIAELESFSYTLVHDMRAPLRSISGFAEVLTMDHAQQLDPEGKKHLARIIQAATRMDQLIIDILDYSQVSRNKPELHPIDLDTLLRDILRSHQDFRPAAADVEISGTLPKIRGNEALLTQCFSNLLHNAVKFVAPGVKPRIRIAANVNGSTVRVEVDDNGIGIAPEATARIFEPFHRENPHYDGTGIGLAIVRKVVDQLDGRVGVESHVGQGSRFWVELKVANPAPLSTPERPVARILV